MNTKKQTLDALKKKLDANGVEYRTSEDEGNPTLPERDDHRSDGSLCALCEEVEQIEGPSICTMKAVNHG